MQAIDFVICGPKGGGGLHLLMWMSSCPLKLLSKKINETFTESFPHDAMVRILFCVYV